MDPGLPPAHRLLHPHPDNEHIARESDVLLKASLGDHIQSSKISPIMHRVMFNTRS